MESDCANQLHNAPWAGIGYGIDWELGTLDIEQIIIELFQQVASLNCKLHVVIVKNSVAKFQLERMLSVVSEGYQLRFADSISETIHILNNAGFDVSDSQVQDFIAEPYY